MELNEIAGRKKSVPSPGYIRAFELYQKPRCRECGRPLHAESSIKRGFGTTCGMTIANTYLNKTETYVGDLAKKLISTWDKNIKEVIDKIRRQEIRILAESMFKPKEGKK